MERDKRFAALALTLKYDGLKLLCMIRLCPLPYSICNGAVSTFPTVHPLMYGLATLLISPKLFVPAFIGSRLRLLSEKNEEMSAGSKAVNICSIVLTVAIGVFTGWYIYKRYRRFRIIPFIFSFPYIDLLCYRTLARAKELEAKEREDIRNSLDQDHALIALTILFLKTRTSTKPPQLLRAMRRSVWDSTISTTIMSIS